MSQTKEIAHANGRTELPVKPVDLDQGPPPTLKDAKPISMDLIPEYWTPETPGESKRGYFLGFRDRQMRDLETDELIELRCVLFSVEDESGDWKTISNGSKRLVGVLESQQLLPGTPLEVTYRGKVKNQTNSFKSDSWSVRPLRIEIGDDVS